MQPIIIIELMCILFLSILFATQHAEHTKLKSSRCLKYCVLIMLFSLTADICAYYFMDASTPFWFRYAVCMLAYCMGGFNAFGFACYSEAFVSEKTDINPWIFRIMKILSLAWVAVAAVLFAAGKMVVFENGVEVQDNGFPLWFAIYQAAVMLYTPVTVTVYRKKIGGAAAVLLSTLNLTTVAGIAIAVVLKETDYSGAYYDCTYVLGTVALILVMELLQRKRTAEQKKELEQEIIQQEQSEEDRKALAEDNRRFFALEDSFVSLYDVELESGHYVSFDRDEFYTRNISDKLVSATEFFDDLRTNVENVVYEEDREDVYRILTREAIIAGLAESDHIDHFYRIITDNGPVWLKMRIVYKDASKKNVIVGVFNAEEEMTVKQKEERFREELLQNNARLFALEDSFESLYDVNLETGHYDVFVKGDFYKGNVLDRLSVADNYFDDLRTNIDSVIYEEDRDGVYASLNRDALVAGLENSDRIDYLYRINAESGPVWLRLRAVYKDAEKKNVIIGVFNAEEEIEAKQLQEALEETKRANESILRQSSFTRFFLDPYVSAYYVGLDDLSCQIFKRTQAIEENYPIITDYLESLTEYINREVCPEQREEFLDIVRPERMKELLSSQTEFVYTYSTVDDRRFVCQVIRGADENHAAFGFRDVTEEVLARQEQELKLKEAENAAKLVETVAGVYRFAFAVDMSGSYFRLIRMDDEVKDVLSETQFDSYQDVITPLFGLLHPDDRERMRHELDFDTVRDRLKSTHSYNIEYRVVTDNGTQWHEMNVTHIARDEVAMGFGEKDLEITKRHLERERFNEYFGLYEADLDTGLMKVLIDSPYYTFSETGAPVPYTPAMKKFAEKQEGETRAMFLELADTDWIKKTLAKDDRHSFAYFSVTAKQTWVEVTAYVTMRHEDGTPSMIALGYSFISAVEAERQNIQRRFIESSQMISGLASGYDALYYINIDEHVFNIYTLNEDKYPGSRDAVTGKTDFYAAIRGYGLSEHVHPDDRYLFGDFTPETIRKKLADSKKFSIRFRMNTPDGYRWNEMNVVKTEDIGEQANAVAVGFEDCDDIIRREQEFQKQLEKARDAAEKASNAKTEFLFNMSHDIRTPMNAILGYTNIALNHMDDADRVGDSLKKIRTSGGHLLNLINDILEMSRIEAGKLEKVNAPVNAYDVTENVRNMSQALADSKDIEFTAEVGEMKNPYVLADELHVNQILINLISNAIKYTPAGGKVRYRVEQISNPENGTARYRLTVSDNGIGMSREFQEHLFESFSREESEEVSKQEGAGLGLSIVKKIVDLIHGTIRVKSEKGRGSEFTIELPLEIMDDAAIEAYEAEKREKTEFAGSINAEGKKVLLVEDNEMNREIATVILGEAGFEVDTAEDGSLAVQAVTAKGPDYYDFVLMDIQMPVMNGYDATREIREMYPDAKLPIIALSANAFEEDRKASIEAGMNDHVAKPINIHELFNILAKYL